MRIISGKYKGRRISPPVNLAARPTTDFAKEGLFNLLQNHIDFDGITILDLFTGTGSIALEFISRGCLQAVVVEQNSTHVAFIRKACNDLKIDNLLILKADVLRFISTCRLKFDFIFADPPYNMNDFAMLPDKILDANLLGNNGFFVLEHSAKYDFSQHSRFWQHRHYGNVNFTFFR